MAERTISIEEFDRRINNTIEELNELVRGGGSTVPTGADTHDDGHVSVDILPRRRASY